jgi:hypothetical protein
MQALGAFSRTRRIAAATASVSLLAGAILQPAGAAASDFAARMGNVAPAGANAMLRFRAAFGGSSARTAPTFALTAGPVWQEQGGSWLQPHLFHNSSVIEIGIDGSGAPVRKFAGIDVTRTRPVVLNAEAASDDKALWLVLGGAAILGSALGLYSMLQDECGNKTYC